MSEAILRNSINLTPADAEIEVVVMGWAQEVRNLGGISFLIVRDRWGTLQVTAPKKKVPPEVMAVLNSLSRESVVKVTGTAKAAG
jgi:aspartyl-tRNA synthetase